MTVHILSAGDGYAYYTSETATADVKRENGRELGDYYTEDGNPPGVWVGSGLAALGIEGTVTEGQMKALYGEGLHPEAENIITAAQASGKSADEAMALAKLGRGYYSYEQGTTDLRSKVSTGYEDFSRINHREPNADERRIIRVREGAQAFRQAKGRQPADKEELGRYITAASRPTQQAVAGFDLVFSPAKSVSTLWGLGDNDTRKTIEAAHEAAIADTIGYLEREAIATRAGANGVAQIDVEGGLIATRFRHYDSRNGDPQLHDHLVVANKVKGVDGKWRTIDSKLLHRQGVAASEFYNQRVMDRVTDALQLGTELREVTAGKRPVVEIAGIDERLTAEFSSRSRGIKDAMKELEKEYRNTHGYAPDAKARIALAQQATLDTRPQKLHARALSELRKVWHTKAAEVVGERGVRDILTSAQEHARLNGPDDSKAERVSLAEAAAAVVETVSEHNAVWGPHTIEAETRRYLQAQHSRGTAVEGTVEQITRHALTKDSISVTPPAPHGAFQPLTRGDGTSIYEHKGRQLLTSRAVLTAEDTLLDAARDRTAQPITRETFDRVLAKEGAQLDAGQSMLAREFATSSNRLVVGSGPAGTGKTTALRVAARAVEAGGGKVIGLAPSATAAAVMRDAIGITATTIHSYIHNTGTLDSLLSGAGRLEKLDLNPGDVIVVDEAGMAGSVNLAKVTRIAQRHGAHVRLIGDDKQLGAVEAGGALRLIEHEVGSVKLETIHRFRNADGTANREEADASAILRDPVSAGDPFAWYVNNGRVTAGDSDRMANEVFAAWQRDTDAGTKSVMIAQKNATVQELNLRAQALAMSTGEVKGNQSAVLSDGLAAHRGDRIVTRANDQTMKLNKGRDFVRNGDLWRVTRVHDDGGLTVINEAHGGRISLPADYVKANAQLGYASTVHRAQGITVETSHVLADAETSRELAYVGLTRGSRDNRMYLVTEDAGTRADVLDSIARNVSTAVTATEAIRGEQARVDDLVTLIDQYSDVHERADVLRFQKVAEQALGTETAAELRAHESWGVVEAALRRSETAGLDPAEVIRQAWGERDMQDANDRPAVLASRILDATTRHTPASPMEVAADQPVPTWIADRRAIDSAHTEPEWREHLTERYEYLQVRLQERGAAIAAEQPEWAQQLGDVPADVDRRQQWTELAAEVDVFRAQYRVDPTEPTAVPAEYRERAVGAELAARVTAMHKADALSSQPPAAEEARTRAASEAATAAQRARQAVTAQTGTAAGTAPQRATDAKSTAQMMKEQQQKRAAERVEQLRRQGVNVKVQKADDRDDRKSGADQPPVRDQGIER